jgi:hypothetical protein
MKNNFCIHIQTIPAHYRYVYKLLMSLEQLVENILHIPIYIVLDSRKEEEEFLKGVRSNLNLNTLSMENIVPNANLEYIEDLDNVLKPKNRLSVFWGAGEHRDYVALKRTYSLLRLQNEGFKNVWCMDSESLVLKSFDILEFLNENSLKPTLLIGTGIKGVRYHHLFKNLFGWSLKKHDPIYNINIRMNDFWFIDTNLYKNMIDYLQKVHEKPVSYFINGSEQSLYEYFTFKSHQDKKIDISLSLITGDMHDNQLFDITTNNDKIDLSKFSTFMNDHYFNKTLSYRGDYINRLNSTERGQELFQKLNIKVAVSNYQGY